MHTFVVSSYWQIKQKRNCLPSDYLFNRWWRMMEKRRSGKLCTKKTTSQMQTLWKSQTSLLSLSTGEQQTHISHATTCTHTYNQQLPQTHLTLHQVLLYCWAQEKLDKSHRHTERQFHLRLFCLSAPSQLLHADPYYPPATSQREGEGWGRGEKRWSESGKGSRTH